MTDLSSSATCPGSWRDYTPGQRWTTAGCTITETHVVTFTGLCGDFFPLHVDEDYAADTEFGTRLVQGPLVYAMAVGLVSRSGVFGDAVLAFLGATDLRHTAPCRIGETIAVTVHVEDSRPTQNPGRGILSLRYDVHGRREQTLLLATMNFLVRGR